jgi:hypothetical protein
MGFFHSGLVLSYSKGNLYYRESQQGDQPIVKNEVVIFHPLLDFNFYHPLNVVA